MKKAAAIRSTDIGYGSRKLFSQCEIYRIYCVLSVILVN